MSLVPLFSITCTRLSTLVFQNILHSTFNFLSTKITLFSPFIFSVHEFFVPLHSLFGKSGAFDDVSRCD